LLPALHKHEYAFGFKQLHRRTRRAHSIPPASFGYADAFPNGKTGYAATVPTAIAGWEAPAYGQIPLNRAFQPER
jgi:hypothetical protein